MLGEDQGEEWRVGEEGDKEGLRLKEEEKGEEEEVKEEVWNGVE